jgi:hypothetical protein
MHQQIDISKNNLEKIKAGNLTFLVVNNLGLDIQTGEQIDLFNDNQMARVIVRHTTNVHLQVNYLAFGFELIPRVMSDDLAFSMAYLTPEQVAKINLDMNIPIHIKNRCATPEVWDLKQRRLEQTQYLNRLETKKPTAENRRKIKEFTEDLKQIEEEFIKLGS